MRLFFYPHHIYRKVGWLGIIEVRFIMVVS